MFKGRGNNQARSITQKIEPLDNVNKNYSLCTQKEGWKHTAGVSQARLHNQNVNAGCFPTKSLSTKINKKLENL